MNTKSNTDESQAEIMANLRLRQTLGRFKLRLIEIDHPPLLAKKERYREREYYDSHACHHLELVITALERCKLKEAPVWLAIEIKQDMIILKLKRMIQAYFKTREIDLHKMFSLVRQWDETMVPYKKTKT